MKLFIVAFVILFVARDSQARMICQDRPTHLVYNLSSQEMEGGTCGEFPHALAYAARNHESTLRHFSRASAASKLSANKCVETVEGLARHGIMWHATESWNDQGTYGLAHYKVSQDYKGRSCQSEYIVKFTLSRHWQDVWHGDNASPQ